MDFRRRVEMRGTLDAARVPARPTIATGPQCASYSPERDPELSRLEGSAQKPRKVEPPLDIRQPYLSEPLYKLTKSCARTTSRWLRDPLGLWSLVALQCCCSRAVDGSECLSGYGGAYSS